MEYIIVTIISALAAVAYYMAFGVIHAKVNGQWVKKMQKALQAQVPMSVSVEEVEHPVIAQEPEPEVSKIPKGEEIPLMEPEESAGFADFMESLGADTEDEIPAMEDDSPSANAFDELIGKLTREEEYKNRQLSSQKQDQEDIDRKLLELEKRGRGLIFQ